MAGQACHERAFFAADAPDDANQGHNRARGELRRVGSKEREC